MISRNTPLPVNDTVFLTSTRRVLGVDTTSGDVTWRSDTLEDPPTAGPASGLGHVYVPADVRLYALDGRTGEIAWTFEADGAIDVVPTVATKTVFVSARNGRVYALDTETGDQRWTYATGSDPVASSPALREDTLFVAAFGSGGTHAIDCTDGTREWTFDRGTHRTGGPSVIVTDDVVYLTQTDTLYALEIDTGELIDKYRFDDRIETTPCLVDSTLYVGSRNHNVYAASGRSDRSATFEITRFALQTDAVPTDYRDTT